MNRKAGYLMVLGTTTAMPIAHSANAAITLNQGNATYVNNAPTSATHGNNAFGTHDFRPEGGATTDHLFASGWFWRINGVDTREFAFNSVGMIEAGSGTAAGTRTWASVGGGAFSAVLSMTLTDGGSSGAAMVTHTMTITNTSANPLDLALFNYLDYDIGGSATGDTATWEDQANDILRISQAPNFGLYQGVNADNFWVTDWGATPTVRTELTDTAVDDLTNAALPAGAIDFTGAFQWNRVLGVGDSTSVTAIMTINQTIPTPGALALLGLAGLVGRRRRA
jgi:hypothetical protein